MISIAPSPARSRSLSASSRIRKSLAGIALLACATTTLPNSKAGETGAQWEAVGWGGGGFYYASAFHPSKNGVVYLGGDVGGLYRSDDSGKNWKMINNGLANYGVFTIAVDRSNPDTLYAATDGGLCKSTDMGESWKLLPLTGPKDLRITGEKNKSIRSVAVDPTDGNTVYAASPAGKVFKSKDGGQTWAAAYTSETEAGDPSLLRVQFGKTNKAFFGGLWTPLKFPEAINPEDAVGVGFKFKGDKSDPKDTYVALTTSDGARYRSRNVKEIFATDQVNDVILKGEDFIIDPEYLKKSPDKAATTPATPDWSKVSRMDISSSGPLPDNQHVGGLGPIFFAATKTTDGRTGTTGEPVLVEVQDLSKVNGVQSYGNIRMGNAARGSIYTVAVSPKNSNLVAAASEDDGLVLSQDKGETWTKLATPKRASGVTFDPVDPNVIYATFFTDGLWKSVDLGKTWTRLSEGLPPKVMFREVAINPANPNDVYVIGQEGWTGSFFRSNDAGKTWKSSNSVKSDYAGNPTLPESGEYTALSIPTNVAVNPLNPKQLYVSANWRPAFSEDGGLTWEERVKGADISCISDIRFSGDRVYASAMDEGTLVSEDNGKSWKQLWPLKHVTSLSGHNWRLAVNTVDGVDRIIATASPWDGDIATSVVVSEDGGKTYKTTTEGFPTYRIAANTMWGRGYPRALAVDPSNPQIAYMGIDGDPTEGKSGGGVFKSEDGGMTWKQLPNQPGSRRMYFGLGIDPTNTQRIYWAAFGNNGGVYRSEDGGATWKHVFKDEQYLFNLLTTPDGTVYASGKNLWRSTDQGNTWKKMTDLKEDRSIVGIEVHPKDPKTLWISTTVWNNDAKGSVLKTVDGGTTWSEITGNLPFVRPQILRFNPVTSELWAGWVGLYKIKQ